MGKIIFVIGGATSGKSRFALELVQKMSSEAVYVATCVPQDAELKKKVENHQKQRPNHWKTVEAGTTPFQIPWQKNILPCLLVDGLTLWVSTLLLKGIGVQDIRKRSQKFLMQCRKKYKHVIMVSDEVGCSIVPENDLARRFREVLGQVNQDTAEAAAEVFWVTAGLPIKIK
jgi:adenosylcobinamide kinase/adenosylcobinamide-phosphate guanylyltransferase